MHQLQELDGKFNITQSTHAQLQLAMLEFCRNISQHAAAHGLDVFHKGLALGGRPHHRANLIQIVLPQW